MKSENLLFANPQLPNYVPTRDVTTFGEINTGNAYYDYYDAMADKENNVIVPLMLFVDGMQIDKNGCLGQEPWMYTLAIFK